MKKSELRQLIREEIEKETSHLDSHADTFIRDVLKLGSKNNIFDSYLNRKNIRPELLSDFVYIVAKKILNSW
jgi:demethoxyubiquinone hydroxylase (CLK1/Coq7/Cat5 family)